MFSILPPLSDCKVYLCEKFDVFPGIPPAFFVVFDCGKFSVHTHKYSCNYVETDVNHVEWIAGSRPGRRGTFSCTRESTQRARGSAACGRRDAPPSRLGIFCRRVPTSTMDCRVPPRQAGYFLLHQRKYPKSVSRGRAPWIPPAQLGCVPLFPASLTRSYAGSIDGLRPPAYLRFGACGPGYPPGMAMHFGVCTVRGTGPQA